MKTATKTTTEIIFGIKVAACKGYPACKVHDGSCYRAHDQDGWKKCGCKI